MAKENSGWWADYKASQMEWQSIYTAPKDGTRVDLWGVNLLRYDKSSERIPNVAWGTVTDWMGNEREDWQHGRGEDFKPTHWLLVTPPTAQEVK